GDAGSRADVQVPRLRRSDVSALPRGDGVDVVVGTARRIRPLSRRAVGGRRLSHAADAPHGVPARVLRRGTVHVRTCRSPLAKRTLQDARRGRWQFAWERLKSSGLSAADWLRYLRPPRRDALAGTPLTADGEFLTPAWAADKRDAKASRL